MPVGLILTVSADAGVLTAVNETSEHRNHLGQPVGAPVPRWEPRPWPPDEPMIGRFCRLERLQPARHAADLHAANSEDTEARGWTYLPYGPFDTLAAYTAWVEHSAAAADPQFHAIIELASGAAVGLASLMRIVPAVGCIEVGHIHFSPRMQRRPAATEAMYLLMRRVFAELGYRRYEWKCDALNAPSRRAAERLGFRFEGVFRQATLYKGRNRDTAWYSIIDTQWPALSAAFEAWLDVSNFDESGCQRVSLRALVAEANGRQPGD